MSQANVERLRAFLETWVIAPDAVWHEAVEVWRRGEADMSMFASDVTYDDENLPDHFGETYRGHEGVLRAVERWIAPFESMSIELLEIVGAEDRLLSIHRWRAKAQHTGIEFDTPLAYIWTFRDGKIIHFRSFLDTADAREAMDLEA
jgi:ketosteroid isomerase-like protein